MLRIRLRFIAVPTQLLRLLLLVGRFSWYLFQVEVIMDNTLVPCTQVDIVQELYFDVVGVVAVVYCRRRVRRVTQLTLTT